MTRTPRGQWRKQESRAGRSRSPAVVEVADERFAGEMRVKRKFMCVSLDTQTMRLRFVDMLEKRSSLQMAVYVRKSTYTSEHGYDGTIKYQCWQW